jgi:putative flippase GtrA
MRYPMSVQAAKSLLTSRSFNLFLLVGFLTAVCYFGIFGLLYSLFHFQYRTSVSVAYVLALLFHFSMNRNVTFLSKNNRLFPQIFRYVIMTVVNYLITLTMVTLAVELFRLSPYVGVAFAASITSLFAYFLSRFWVFQQEV